MVCYYPSSYSLLFSSDDIPHLPSPLLPYVVVVVVVVVLADEK